METKGYTEQVNAIIEIVITFNEDQLDENLNDEIKEFLNLLNKACKLKQRENAANETISQANTNTQSGILELEKNQKSVNKAQEDNKQSQTAFVEFLKKKLDLKANVLELHNQ